MKEIEQQSGPQIGWLVEPKFDGQSILLHYRDGKFNAAWSRGKIIDGESLGYNISGAARYIEGVLGYLRDNDIVDVTAQDYLVRGEVIIHKSIFKENYIDNPNPSPLAKTYKSPRNFVVGLTNSIDPKAVKEDLKRCTFIALSLFRKDKKGIWKRLYNSHKEWVLLTLMGFTTSLNPTRYSEGHWKLRKLIAEGHRALKSVLPVHEFGGSLGEQAYWDHYPTADEVIKRMQAIHKAVDVYCDGLVIQPINNKVFQDRNHHLDSHPSFMRAIKLDPSQQTTYEGVVGNIEWNISKRGLLKPVIIFREGIEVESATIDRCTGINARFIEVNDIRPGRRVKCIRSGEVIPRLISVYRNGKWISVDGGEKTNA